MTMTIQEIANRLYNAHTEECVKMNFQTVINLWVHFFTLEELRELWKGCQADLDTPYDDEVYEALKSLGEFK